MPRTFRSGDDVLRQLDVRPDDTDSRDYIFSPSLTLLPKFINPGPLPPTEVLNQGTEGACVGHALAAVINANTALTRFGRCNGDGNSSARGRSAAQALSDHEMASQRMLYEMARRHDEWEGQNYDGTTLRGAMKGWHKHGVTSSDLWPYKAGAPGHLTPKRTQDARRRPLGAYFRVTDSDVAHIQAAIHEADAVLASAWVHRGWMAKQLLAPPKDATLQIKRIDCDNGLLGLHAFALVGYGPEGFIVQNSWGTEWGDGGFAVLSYEDWMKNRQDAWVARPGPESRNRDGVPTIFLDCFAGQDGPGDPRAGTSGVEGLGIDAAALPHIINTGADGKLSGAGRLTTDQDDLPRMASLVRLTRARKGFRDVVLYAHGGLVSETVGAVTAGRLWKVCRKADLTAYFFVWETGISETALGWLHSQADVSAPRAGFDLGSVWHSLEQHVKDELHKAQKDFGRALAPAIRVGWSEMHARAQKAAKPKGGAARFAEHLFAEMNADGGAEPFRLNIVGHSAGAIYLARLYEHVLAAQVAASNGKVVWGSMQFAAPALSIELFRSIFAPDGTLPIPSNSFQVHALKDDDEDRDNICIYPSSLLTYVADCLEDTGGRIPLLGIHEDLQPARKSLGSPKLKLATHSQRHGEFDDEGHEVEKFLESLVR